MQSQAPDELEYVPALQFVHPELPEPDAYLPAGQAVHPDAPEPGYVPHEQLEHEDAPLEEYPPAVQVLQLELPAELYVPAEHVVQELAHSSEYWPAEQELHVQPFSPFLPAVQHSHSPIAMKRYPTPHGSVQGRAAHCFVIARHTTATAMSMRASHHDFRIDQSRGDELRSLHENGWHASQSHRTHQQRAQAKPRRMRTGTVSGREPMCTWCREHSPYAVAIRSRVLR